MPSRAWSLESRTLNQSARGLFDGRSKQQAVGRKQKAERRTSRPERLCSLPAVCCLLLTVLTGCESLQRKFIRKSKVPQLPPTPVIQFQDYSQATTPLDRYRKHYLLFDYWNQELVDALMSSPLNSKRFIHASAESLTELRSLQQVLADESAGRLGSVIQDREVIDQQLQSGSFSAFQVNVLVRTLDTQTRHIRREFFWRSVQDHLKQERHVSSDDSQAR